jgi:hypothetical protein
LRGPGADPCRRPRDGRDRSPAVLKRAAVDERQPVRQQGFEPLAFDAALKKLEFGEIRARDPRPPQQVSVPSAVLQHEPEDEQDVLELRFGNQELSVGPDAAQERVLEWQSVALGQVVADDELVVRVNVDDLVGLRIEAVIVEDPRKRERPQGELERKTVHDCGESVAVGARDQQVEVAVTRSGAIEKRVALEMAVANLIARKLVADLAHERNRRASSLRVHLGNA